MVSNPPLCKNSWVRRSVSPARQKNTSEVDGVTVRERGEGKGVIKGGLGEMRRWGLSQVRLLNLSPQPVSFLYKDCPADRFINKE